MKVRFLADADLNRAVVSGVVRREPSVDFLTAQAAGLRGMDDSAVLTLAAELKRVVVSHDVGTMPAHFARFVATRPSPGLIIVDQDLDIRRGIEELLLIWTATDIDEWRDKIGFVPI